MKKQPKKAKALSFGEERFEYPDGSVLYARIDMPGFQTRQQAYFNALMTSRELPNNTEALSPKDPVLTHYTNQFRKKLENKTATMESVVRQVRGFYEKEITQAKTDSTILAMFDTDETEIAEERQPTPYEETSGESGARWLMKEPKIIRDLSDPAESQLKIIYDLFVERPEVAAKITVLAETLAVKINMIEAGLVELNSAGFLAAATSAAVGEAIDALVSVENDGEPTAD